MQEAAAPLRAALEGDGLTRTRPRDGVTLFLCGDVMTGRGIDQILAHPGNPRLHEGYMRSALGYVELAERVTGPIERPVDDRYVWGDTLDACREAGAQARIVNLETAVTVCDDAWPGKDIHYRMHPRNVGCLAAAALDVCVLANNHVLDWGYRGLEETLATLHAQAMRTAGAGRAAAEAAAPAIVDIAATGRVLVLAFGMSSAGVARAWAAAPRQAGVNYLDDLSSRSVERIAREVQRCKQAGDVMVVSVHWGANWGYGIERAQRDFAHRLIDAAQVDVVHGHSSHHPKAIEVYRDRLILYGCGDYLNDYEGIGGYASYRPDLALAYFPTIDVAAGRLMRLRLVPMQIRHLRVTRACTGDARWLARLLDRESEPLGTRLAVDADGCIVLERP